MPDLIDYGELYKSSDEAIRKMLIECFGFPKSVMACCANCKHNDDDTKCIVKNGVDLNGFCVLYEPKRHKNLMVFTRNDREIITSSIKKRVEEYESKHFLHLHSENPSHINGEDGMIIYMFDDDYYTTKRCVGCFIPDHVFAFIWEYTHEEYDDSIGFVNHLDMYLKSVFDSLYRRLYDDDTITFHEEMYTIDIVTGRKRTFVEVALYRSDIDYDYTKEMRDIKYNFEYIGNIRRY